MTAKHTTPLPHLISIYLKKKFPEGFIEDIEVLRDNKKQKHYKIVMREDDNMHTLEFDAEGKLTNHTQSPFYEEEYYEGWYYGEPDNF